LEKIDKRLEAIDFYNNLIENYPDTNEAKKAKKRLRSLSK
jgi:TolA-binding protein